MAQVGSCSGAGQLKVPRPAPSQCLRSRFAAPVTHTKTDLRQMGTIEGFVYQVWLVHNFVVHKVVE